MACLFDSASNTTETENNQHKQIQNILLEEAENIPVQQFLSKSSLFRFLSFGSRCNGNANHSFSEATCDLTKLMKNKPKGMWYGIPMTEVFESGYKFLQSMIDETKSYKSSKEESAALSLLTKFFKEKDTHEKCILNALEKMSTAEKLNKERILTTALAEHLFGKLSLGQEYLVDSRTKGKDSKWKENSVEKCECGCSKEISLGATGIGDEAVWHGFVDIMMMKSNNKPESTAIVCLDLDVDDGTSADEENDLECCSEVKLSVLESVQDQVAAQTVVFALAYQTANPMSRAFIPNILIGPSKFYIVMYEPVNDILVWSTELPLFGHTDKRLQGVSIITLWMVLNYKLSCKGAEDIFENVSEMKAGFRNQIDEDHWVIYKNWMKTEISSFSAVPSLDLVHSLNDVDYDLPKLKRKKLRTF